MRRWLLGAVAIGVLGSACQSASDESVMRDSNSNWLTACSDSDDCDPDSTCFNERCVTNCGSDGDCAGNATCQSASVVDGCVSFGEGSKQCFAGCDRDGDCDALGNALSCVEGACVHQGKTCEAGLPPSGEPEDAGPVQSPEPEGPGPVPSLEPSPEPEGPSNVPLPGPVPSGPVPAPSGSVVAMPTASTPGPVPSGTPVPSSSVPVEPDVSPANCPVLADTCPAGCTVVDAFAISTELQCMGSRATLGCSEAQEVTADARCIRGSDGTLYAFLPSTFAVPLIESGEFEDCTEAERQIAADASGTCEEPSPETCGAATCAEGERCCDSCQGFCANPNDGVVCPDDTEPERVCEESSVVYSARMTNATGCCDFYTVIRFEPELEACIVVQVRQEVGSDPEATSAQAIVGVEDCWQVASGALPEEDAGISAGQATDIVGTVELASPGIVVDLQIEFADGPEAVQGVVTFRSTLPTDGEWYPEQ